MIFCLHIISLEFRVLLITDVMFSLMPEQYLHNIESVIKLSSIFDNNNGYLHLSLMIFFVVFEDRDSFK